MADNHVVYKNGAKEIAFLNGCSITFMAKPFQDWIGNSCHIHSSLWRDGEPCFATDEALFSRWLAGQIACFKELAIFLAPTINSYKRFAAGSWAPTTLAWGNDNRTCGFRVVGHGAARRAETRIPGGDANPYLAFAAVIAAGLHGIEHELELPPGLEGNAYESDAERFPSTMREAIAALEGGTMARGGVRRPGRRPLPQLRPHRAGAVRRLRHRLGAQALLRARVSAAGTSRERRRRHSSRALACVMRAVGRSSASPRTRSPRAGAPGSCPPRSCRSTTSTRSSRPAVARSSCRRASTASRRRSTCSTGIVFSGGIDIDPAHYGAERHPATDPAQAHRDAGELRLLEAALERDLPTLAICRGFQLLNVLRGGDLVQHLPEEVGHEGHRETLGVFSEHPVEVQGGDAARGDPRAAARLRPLEPPPGRRPGRRGARRERVRRGRVARGDRGSVEAVRPRRALAPGDGGGRQAPVRGARRRGARLPRGPLRAAPISISSRG